MTRIALVLIFFISCALRTQAAEEESKKEKKQIPVSIVADSSKYHGDGFIIYFKGNVHVDDGQMKLTCDDMTVKLDKDRNPQLIICENNVVIRKETTISHSDRAEYFLEEEKIILTGNPKITRTDTKGEKQTMSGKKIVFYRNNNLIESHGVGMEFPGGAAKKTEEKEDK